MNEKDCEEMAFNPFYIGPHPSQACTTTNSAASTAHQCSPESPDSKSSAPNTPEQQDNSQPGVTQTVAGNTKATPAAAATAAAPAVEPVACAPYPCNDVRK